MCKKINVIAISLFVKIRENEKGSALNKYDSLIYYNFNNSISGIIIRYLINIGSV
tara:strand:- start:38 stop:202 length:165 start_codon:yes stop_codon:yes gene_type:complete